MTRDDLLALLATARQGSKEQFHRFVFEALNSGRWLQSAPVLNASEVAQLLEQLRNWVAQASIADSLGQLRLLVVRRPLRAMLDCLACPPEQFIASALQINEALPLAVPESLPAWKQQKLALLADVGCVTHTALQQWASVNRPAAMLFAIVALDDQAIEAVRSAGLNQLAEWLVDQPPVDLPVEMLQQVQMAAFAVSYLTTPAKHRAKRAIVAQAAHLLRGVAPAMAVRAPAAGKPRLTVVTEFFFPQHAMYRCYAELLAELRARFHVCLLAEAPSKCAEHASIADEVSYFAYGERNMAVLAKAVCATAPDVILYPSVGMTLWSFSLSLLRLAPLQLASVGHPAPSCSPHVDGAVVFERLQPDASEGYGPLHVYARQPLPAPPAGSAVHTMRREGSAPVIGVNAAFMKLNADFLQVVEQILAAAPSGTSLRFFPNLHGVPKLAIEARIKQRFPDAQVFEASSYTDYMRELSVCDLVLQSFPFGGTNTAMDALSVGVPILSCRGNDLSAMVDPLLLESAGLPELCAANPADYCARAIHLLNDRAALAELTSRTAQACSRLDGAVHQGGRSIADSIYEAWTVAGLAP